MVSYIAVLSGVFEIIFGMLWLGSVIYKPSVEQPSRVFIGRVLMPISPLFLGSSMVMQPSTAQMALPSILGFILAMTALFLQIRFRPQRR